MDITTLPKDIFLLIIAYLSPKDLILNRRVSNQFHAAFTESDLNRYVLLQHYPRVRELRGVNQDGYWSVDWTNVFSKVASRYHYLKTGLPRGIERLALGKSFIIPQWARHYPVSPWHRHLQFEEKTAPFHYPDPLWTYDEGILIFPSAQRQRYELYALESGTVHEAELKSEGKIVRRIRLKERVLVVEWCENEAYHQLNENEMVYRHFATAYDVLEDASTRRWSTRFR